MRQIDASSDVGNEQLHGPLCRGLLAADAAADLAQPNDRKKIRGLTSDQMARMEREMEGYSARSKRRDSYGDSVLNLVVAPATLPS